MPNMSKFLQTLILASALALLASPAARGQQDSTSFAYDFWGDRPSSLSLQGDAHYPSDTTFLRLTNTAPTGNALAHRVGRAVHTAPIKFWEAGAHVDFETTVKFIIRPNPGSSAANPPGDGLAFFIVPVGDPVRYTGASFGVFDIGGSNSHVFAAEFDIYANAGVDPNFRHIGIDIESNISKNTTDVGDAFLIGQEVTAIIDYKQDSKLIRIQATAGGVTHEVSYVFDLSTILPQNVQVGVSASTGGAAANHELVAWYFQSTLVKQGAANSAAGIRQYV